MPRSDAPRHRGPGGQGDRSGIAAFLSPLRARPALRCPGEARIARPAAAGTRAQSASSPDLRVVPACALPEQSEGDELRRQLFRPARRLTSRSKRARTETSSPASMAIRSAWESSAPARRIARRTCARVCRSASFASERPEHRQGDSTAGPAIGRARPAGVPPRRARDETARTRSSSSRRFPTIGRERRSSARPTFSSCRGSRTCAGAATRWSWSRRAPARCSGSAIRRSRPPWPCCPHRNRSNGSVGRTVFPGLELLALLVDCQILFKVDAASDSGLRPAEGDDNLVLWDFHDLPVPRAQHGRPARQSDGRAFIPMPASWLRCRRCGRAGPERKSICARSRPRPRGANLAGREAPARTSLDAQLR